MVRRRVLNLLVLAVSGEQQYRAAKGDDQANSHDFTETDVMRLFLDLLDAIEDQPLVTEIEVPEPGKEGTRRTGGTWQFYVLGGILLIIVLFFIRRRKKSDRDQN